MIFLSDQEVQRVGKTRTRIAYCPISHQYSALGVMRLRDLRDSGAVVGLGYDGASGHRQDMFEQMTQSILLQRVHTLEPTVSTAEEALELATREGARYLGSDAGVLAPEGSPTSSSSGSTEPTRPPCTARSQRSCTRRARRTWR